VRGYILSSHYSGQVQGADICEHCNRTNNDIKSHLSAWRKRRYPFKNIHCENP